MHNHFGSTSQAVNRKKERLFLDVSTLILLTYASAFFPRLLASIGFPSIINFAHFALVPCTWAIAIATTRSKNKQQLAIVKELLWGLGLLFGCGLISAFWNGAGVINFVLSFLILSEPFMFLTAIIVIPLSDKSFTRLQTGIIVFLLFHLFLMYIQYGLGFCNLPGDCDNIQGVLYRSGGGHPVAASIACCFALYNFAAKSQPIWLRAALFILGFITIQLADAKQVVVMFVGAWIILTFTNIQNIRKTIIYLITLTIFLLVFTWAINNIEALTAFKTWIRPELYGSDGEATKFKLSGIRYVLTFFTSPVNWLVGLGPGHSVSRMGGWMMRDYGHLLNPLGATSAPSGQYTSISQLVWYYTGQSWLAQGSSFFSPFWGWAGIWGDLGFLGLGTYLYLGSVVWRRVCADNTSKLLLLTVVICGFIFTQMEEPAYMLSVATLIALKWQKERISRSTKISSG